MKVPVGPSFKVIAVFFRTCWSVNNSRNSGKKHKTHTTAAMQTHT